MLEKIHGLQASVLADEEANLDLESITVGVSLERGLPALLLFTLLQNNNSISKSAEIKTKKAIYHLEHRFYGRSQQKVEVKSLNGFVILDKCFEILVVSCCRIIVFYEFLCHALFSLFYCRMHENKTPSMEHIFFCGSRCRYICYMQQG